MRLECLRERVPLICNRYVSAPSLTGFGKHDEMQTGFGRCKSPGLGYPYKWADSLMPLPESTTSPIKTLFCFQTDSAMFLSTLAFVVERSGHARMTGCQHPLILVVPF